MKRHNNLYKQIYSVENLQLADVSARRGKKGQYGIINHDKKKESNILLLHNMLKNYDNSCFRSKTLELVKKKCAKVVSENIAVLHERLGYLTEK